MPGRVPQRGALSYSHPWGPEDQTVRCEPRLACGGTVETHSLGLPPRSAARTLPKAAARPRESIPRRSGAGGAGGGRRRSPEPALAFPLRGSPSLPRSGGGKPSLYSQTLSPNG